MSDHPSTFKGDPGNTGEIDWDDRATLQLNGTVLRRGTFAEMIRHIGLTDDHNRDRLVIEKAGDRAYTAEEAEELSRRADFPIG